MRVGGQDRAELALARRRREILNERRRGGEEGVEAVLDRAVGDDVRVRRALSRATNLAVVVDGQFDAGSSPPSSENCPATSPRRSAISCRAVPRGPPAR